jgi:hypothetical protein
VRLLTDLPAWLERGGEVEDVGVLLLLRVDGLGPGGAGESEDVNSLSVPCAH